ncbi:MAG: RnfABCDGE type electron transport complex subunit G [Actinomycetota bacterium]|nr:RnfABCDGE type electron transport complex subunit G [Actinomycetota bacterium]
MAANLAFRLMVVGLAAAICLGLTYVATKDRIATQKEAEEKQASMDSLPALKSAADLKEERELEKKAAKLEPSVEKVFSSPVGYVILLASKGYGGQIRMGVGIDNAGVIQGVSIISQSETPGLGSNIQNEEFLRQFVGKGETSEIKLDGEIKAVTGATISSTGVAEGVRKAMKVFDKVISGRSPS